MTAASSIGFRLDRLPLSGFHYRLLGLIAAGMFFDSFDIYIAGAVLAAIIHSGESTLQLNAAFVSATFIGMMTGAWLSGILGDRFGRRMGQNRGTRRGENSARRRRSRARTDSREPEKNHGEQGARSAATP